MEIHRRGDVAGARKRASAALKIEVAAVTCPRQLLKHTTPQTPPLKT